jgi:hypothetical protein
MAETILFVFEGERAEPHIFNLLQPYFFPKEKHPIFHLCFGGEIYQLLRMIKNDPDLDLVELLKERSSGFNLPSDIDRESVSQIFLFFDHDGHSSLANDENLASALELFNEETDAGKLYVSYPMIEAIRDISSGFENRTVSLDALSSYKREVNERNSRLHLNKLEKKEWLLLFEQHLKKGNWLIHQHFDFETSAPQQPEILLAQMKTFFPKGEIAILSGIPFFVFEYFGTKLFNEE